VLLVEVARSDHTGALVGSGSLKRFGALFGSGSLQLCGALSQLGYRSFIMVR